MPSDLVEYQQGIPAWRHSQTGDLQVQSHGLGICIQRYKLYSRIPTRVHGTKDVSYFSHLANITEDHF